jgi:hypothetical protein
LLAGVNADSHCTRTNTFKIKATGLTAGTYLAKVVATKKKRKKK